MSRYALFHLFRPRGALGQDESLKVFDTHDAVEQHDAAADERQRCSAGASAQRWPVAAARVRDIDTVLRHCAPALDGVAPDISQPQRVTAVRRAILGAMSAAQPNKSRPSPTKPAEPSRNPLSQTTPSRHPRLGSGRPTITLTRQLPVSRRGAHGLEASVTSDRHGRQHRLTHLLIYAMQLAPETPPQTLTQPSLQRRACMTLILSFNYVQVRSVVCHLPSRPGAMSLPCAERSLAPHHLIYTQAPTRWVPQSRTSNAAPTRAARPLRR